MKRRRGRVKVGGRGDREAANQSGGVGDGSMWVTIYRLAIRRRELRFVAADDSRTSRAFSLVRARFSFTLLVVFRVRLFLSRAASRVKHELD